MERFTTRPELRGTFGMVASTHWLASAAGMAMLERGGNAFDAAVAAGFVLQVVEPHLNGPGGEVPILLYSAERDEVLVVDGQGTAPAAATIERFRELGHELVPGTGLLAACVPGAFDAWLLLLREFGTLPLAEVLEPAIGYAENGYPLVPGICADDRQDGAGLPRRVAGVGRALPAGAEAGHALPQPRPGRDLPARARRVGRRARAFYDGFVAEAIAAFASARHGLAAHRRRPRLVARLGRAAGHAPLRGLGRLQDRAVGPGAGLPAAARAARRLRARRPRGPGLRPHGRRVREARLRRPRGLVRRRRRPARRPAERRVRGRAAQARRRRGLGRAAARQPGRPRAAAPAHPGGARPSPEPASRPAATPATWTWSTASATPSRRRPAAAGCTARR